MQITFASKGNFEATQAWLKKITGAKPSTVLNSIANEGKQSLSSNTPKDTGETAAGWKTKIIQNGDNYEVNWYNDAHPETDVNLAVLIDQGHGTRNGGYVSPRPYIKKSMDGVFNTAGDKIAKELIK